jgi:hypothetical protein
VAFLLFGLWAHKTDNINNYQNDDHEHYYNSLSEALIAFWLRRRLFLTPDTLLSHRTVTIFGEGIAMFSL